MVDSVALFAAVRQDDSVVIWGDRESLMQSKNPKPETLKALGYQSLRKFKVYGGQIVEV